MPRREVHTRRMDDPGWQLRPSSFLPIMPTRRLRSGPASSGGLLATLRDLFVSFCVAIALIGVVVIVLGDVAERDRAALSATIVVVVGASTIVAGALVKRQLDCSSDAALASSYRTRFFLRLAVAEWAALVALVSGLVLGPWWIYFVGAAFTALEFARLAPTQAHLEADQRRLTGEGCHRSLVAVLTSAPTTDRRR